MKLAIIIVVHNMQREAPRTLFSVSRNYQTEVDDLEYEVIAIDNGSSLPLSEGVADSNGANFRQYYYPSSHPSPCEAINAAVAAVEAEYVMCCVDGARILSPGIVGKTLQAARVFDHPFIYTLSMHLGNKVQNQSMMEGYNQQTEDALLASLDWRGDGYRLFDGSCVALSSRQGFFSALTESNCFTMRRDDYLSMGGFNEAFVSPGGGLCNLDIFWRAHQKADMTPVMLLGEATFHQFHGGVATNVAMDRHPFQQMNAEYARINGQPWRPIERSPVYFGDIPGQARRFLNAAG